MSKKQNGKKQEPKVTKVERTLACKLSKHEVADRALRAAHLIQTRDNVELEAKASQGRSKAHIKQLEADIRLLSAEIRDETTDRLVQCEERKDFARNAVETVRLDTNEKIDERPMTALERQGELFPEPEPTKPKRRPKKA